MDYIDEKLSEIRHERENLEFHNITDGKAMIGGTTYFFERTFFLDRNSSLLLPTAFKELSKEKAKLKYPSEHRPAIILSDLDDTTTFTFSALDMTVQNGQMPTVLYKIHKIISKPNPAILFSFANIKRTSNIEMGILKYKSLSLDDDLFNVIFFFPVYNQVGFFTFSCLFDHKELWEVIVDQMIESVQIEQKIQ